MSNLENALHELREKRDRALSEVEKLNQVILGIESLNGIGASAKTNQPKRTMSAAGRRRIAAAQRARWAKLKGESAAPKPKRHISATGKKRIAAASRARWAQFRAEKKAA